MLDAFSIIQDDGKNSSALPPTIVLSVLTAQRQGAKIDRKYHIHTRGEIGIHDGLGAVTSV